MSKLRVQSFAISIDGYGAGPSQDLQNPLGISGPELMEWFFHTRVWRKMHSNEDGEAGVDNEIAEQAYSDQASTSGMASICMPWAMNAPTTSQANARPTSF